MAELRELQTRVQELELRLYGESGAHTRKLRVPRYHRNDVPGHRLPTSNFRVSEIRSYRVTDGLIKVHVGLGNVASKRERVKTLYKKIDDLMKYLDPQYIDRIAVPDAMKLEFILAEEPYILSQAALLEQLHSLQPLLDSEHIKAVPAQASKLQTLSQVHIKQQDQSEEVTAESKRLLEDYNKMTLLLSKQFVMWDEVLSRIEAARQVKPRSE